MPTGPVFNDGHHSMPKGLTMTAVDLTAAAERAREIRSQYEVLENRLNGQPWNMLELMVGFSNDVGTVGRLLLAHEGTWGIDGDPQAELAYKLSESMWWIFVLADRLGIDMSAAYSETMDKIATGLDGAISAEPETD